MKITIDRITDDERVGKVVYLHFLDDDNTIVDTISIAFTDDPDAFNAAVKEKFSNALRRVLDLQDAKKTIQSHLDKLPIGEATLDADTKVVIFKK